MRKRRLSIEALEERLCLAAPTLQTTFNLPSAGSYTTTVYRASPLFVDIFNTGKENFISVAAGAKLVAYASNPDGSASPVVTYQVPGGLADLKSTPIVVVDPRNGQKNLFAAMGRDEGRTGSLEDGRVFGWNLQTGQLLPGWTQGQSTGRDVGNESGVYGALTSGILESNGLPDIVVTSFSSYVTAFRLDGSTLWQWTNDDTILSGAVVGDIDRDGQAEVVVGGDSSNNGFYQSGGWVNVLSSAGILKWRKFIPGEVTWSSPVLADLKNNGYLDIVIGTGLNYQTVNIVVPGSNPNAQVQGNLIYALDPFGNVLPGWPYATTSPNNPVPHEVLAAPAVADLLGNGQLEVVALDRAGYIHVVQPNGQPLAGFVGGKSLAPDLPQSVLPDNYGSPIIADVNGDGRPDIIAPSGPFLRALDPFGNLISIATTTVPPGAGSPEGIDAAAAVGNFNGTPGSLVLAFVAHNPLTQSRPDQVQIFRLPASNLAPPWPFLRRTLGGDAVARSVVFDNHYVETVFNTALGFIPGPVTIQKYAGPLNANTSDLLATTLSITTSPLARQAQVRRVYNDFLGRPADAGGLAGWTNFLATNSYNQLEYAFAVGPEFAARAQNQIGREVVQLYQAILHRTPSQAEVNAWVATRQPVGALANIFLNGEESLNVQLSAIYQPAFGPGSQNFIAPDASAAYALDIHRNVRDGVIIANILASGGQYAATNATAGYVADLYRDILRRNASPSEVANFVRAVDNGSIPLLNIAAILLNSVEARGVFIQDEFQARLGHRADPGTVANLSGYANREVIPIFLVGSPEFYSRSGGTPAGFVRAAFLSLTSITIDQATVDAFVARMRTGLSTAGVANAIIYGGSLYFNNIIINQLMTYLPDQRLGVLRSGNLPPTAPGQPINPDPNLINFLTNLHNQGFTDEQSIAVILTSPQYFGRVAYYKGILRSPGIRN